MAKDFAKQFYKSIQWQRCRESYIVTVFGLCEKCRKPGHIVHHKIRLTPENINDPDITLNHKHLQYLCIECHNAIDCEDVTRNDVMFDDNGNLIKR